MTPRSLINPKSISAAIEYFFGRGELSQVVDQTNPLSMLTHERRLSALGPGGLNRKRAGFEVRDVHISHYGRICPIETPEGTNIGLISSLAIYSAVDEYGFLVTPYRKVTNGKLADEVVWLRADEESEAYPGAGRRHRSKTASSRATTIIARYHADFELVPIDKVQYIDVAPSQMVGVSAGLIPFLEHDDANRALMGSNMQRQAVPLLVSEPPIVATGMERDVAHELGHDRPCPPQGNGHATSTPTRIEIGGEVYPLRKFVGLNERTCQNQKPIVEVGQKVEKGEAIADGAATFQGELALGRNVLVGFMAWDGFNFEDAIIISEELVEGRHLHLDPHRRVRHRNSRDEAGPRGVHARHSQRQRKGPAQPRRKRHRAHRHLRPAGRHPGRQGFAQVEDRADAGRKAAARHLRPRRRRREERFARRPLGRGRHRHRHAEVLAPHEPVGRRAQGLRKGPQRGRNRRGRQDRRRLPARWSRRWKACCSGRWPTTRGRALVRDQENKFIAEQAAAVQARRDRHPQPAAQGRRREDPQDAMAGRRGRHRRPRPQAELDEARRRTAQRRAANGQGLYRRQARDLGRRQDGRPPRQQGRHRQDSAAAKTCRFWPTARRCRSCSIRWACPAV